MAGHVVGTFIRVDEVGRVFRHQMIEEAVQIRACRGIGIFIDDQGAARVLDKDCGRAGADAAVGNDALALIRDLIGALASGAEAEAFGVSWHNRKYKKVAVMLDHGDFVESVLTWCPGSSGRCTSGNPVQASGLHAPPRAPPASC